MSIISGLGAIDTLLKKQSLGDRPDINWVRLGPEESVKISFLQELDEDSDNFNPVAGTAFIAVEHQSPSNFKRKALCTISTEGRCWPCEQQDQAPSGDNNWRARGHLYANVVVDNGADAPHVAILSQGISSKSITPTLVQYATDGGSITDTQFRIKRSGKSLATSYSLSPIPRSSGVNAEDYDLFDIEKIVVRTVPYIDQEDFFNEGSSQESTPSALEW